METMEKLLFEFIAAGMILLTLSLISGFMFFSDILTHYLSHEIFLSLISWVVFGVLLLGRYTQGWRGQQAIRWTLTGFSLLMLSYFGSKLLMDMELSELMGGMRDLQTLCIKGLHGGACYRKTYK